MSLSSAKHDTLLSISHAHQWHQNYL